MTYSLTKLIYQLKTIRYISLKSNIGIQSVHADLVLSILRQILHPRRGLVATAVHDLQVAHLEP